MKKATLVCIGFLIFFNGISQNTLRIHTADGKVTPYSINQIDSITFTDIVIPLTYIRASDSNIQYIGRIDFTDKQNPLFSNPGISIRAKFQGPAIDVILKDYGTGTVSTTNYYTIIIDGSLFKVLKVNNKDTIYEISHTLTDTIHTIEIYKRTESSVGRTAFKGFQIKKGTTLLTPNSLPVRKLEFIGASMTCGYGNDTVIATSGNPTTGFTSKHEDNYNSFGAITSRSLNTQYVCVGHAGKGIYRNQNNTTTNIVPDFYQYYSLYQKTQWDFTKYIPDVVVINLGNNDFAPEASTPPSMVDSAKFVNAFITFTSTIRSKYPNAKIICTAGCMMNDYYPAGLKAWTRIQSYLQEVITQKQQAGDNQVYYVKFNPQSDLTGFNGYGEDWHPTIATHQAMANILTPYIKGIMGW